MNKIKDLTIILLRNFLIEEIFWNIFGDLLFQRKKTLFRQSPISRDVGRSRVHFQAPSHAQAKLVRCGRGAIFDVALI